MKTDTNLDRPHASEIDASELRAHADDLQEFSGRLRALSPYPRKLLLHIAELAYHGRGQQRKPDVAYLPELYECTGLGVEAMYPLLEELKQGQFIELEDQYPFEDVRIASSASGVNVVRTIARFCEQEKIPLHDVLVDMRFELLP